MRPRWLWALLLGLTGCSPAGLLNWTIPDGAYSLEPGIAYGPLARQRLDVYRPRQAGDAAPVVVFFYGGSWQTGRREDYRFVGEAFASQGLVTVIADYRVFPAVRFPGFVEDAAAAVAWVRASIGERGGDPRALFIAGHSAGAQIAALLALDPHYLAEAGLPPDAVRGLIGLAGPYDFLPLTDPVLKDVFSPGDIRRSQPIRFADGLFSGGAKPPAFLATGSADGSVRPRNTRRLAAALRAAGNEVTERVYPGVGHIGLVVSLAYRLRGNAPTLADAVGFVRATMAPDGRRSTRRDGGPAAAAVGAPASARRP